MITNIKNSPSIGLIGLGAMGLGMASSLRRNGYGLNVCDVRFEVAENFALDGGVAFKTPSELAKVSDIIISVVVNAEQTETILFGEHGAVNEMKQKSLFIMCSTVDPNWSVLLERRLNKLGFLYLDAPISGGAAKAATGQITMMTSGHTDAYQKVENILEAMASNIYKLGDRAGFGSKVKIINQLLAGVHIAVAAEAMALGIREGVDPNALYEVITHSAGNSWMFENRMAHVLQADYTALSAVDIFIKDLGLVLDTARASKFPLPLAATAHQMFMQASAAGYGREDDAAVIKIFPGIKLPDAK